MSKTIEIPEAPTEKEIETAARALWNERSVHSATLSFDMLDFDDRKALLVRAKAATLAIRGLYK